MALMLLPLLLLATSLPDVTSLTVTTSLIASPNDTEIYVYEISEALELTCNYTALLAEIKTSEGNTVSAAIAWSDTFANATYTTNGSSLTYNESTFTFDQEGSTTCTVTFSKSGSSIYSTSHIFNITLPEMETDGTVVVGVAETGVLGCQIDGNNEAEIEWNWPNGSDASTGISTNFANSEMSSNLTVTAVALRDGGNFSCVIEEAKANVLLIVYSVACSPSQMVFAGATLNVMCWVDLAPPGGHNISINLDLDGEKGMMDKEGFITAMAELRNIQDDDSLSWTLEIEGSKVKSGVIEIYAFNITDLTCPLLEFSSGSIECEGKTCNYTCPSDQYYQSGDSLLTNKTVTCDGATSQWSHTSKDNPLGDLPICSAKVVAKSRSMVADIIFTGTSACTSGMKSDITTYFTSTSSDYPCLTAGTCTISDVTCTASVSSSKVTLKVTVAQVGSSAAGVYAFESQLTSNPTSISLTLSKRKRSLDPGSGLMREQERFRRSTTISSASVTTSYKVECGTGAGQVGSECLQCPAGSYSSSSGTCQKCARGYYQPNSGSSQCAQCDKGLNTVATGSDSITDCTVTCDVAPISNGHRSPASGYTVSDETPIATFCGIGYSILPHEEETAPCFEIQPSCYKSCTIDKKSDNAVIPKETTQVGYKYALDYECSNKEGKTYEVICETEGAGVELTCPDKLLMIILICVAVVLLLAILVAVIIVQKSRRHEEEPPPPESTGLSLFTETLIGSFGMTLRRLTENQEGSPEPAPPPPSPPPAQVTPEKEEELVTGFSSIRLPDRMRPRALRPKEPESETPSSDTSVIGTITGTLSSFGRSIRGTVDGSSP